MEFQKITNFLDVTSDNEDLPKFVTKTLIEVYDQSEENNNVNKEIKIKISTLRSGLCDVSDAYVIVKGNIIVNKKTSTVDDIEEPNNTVANANATNAVNNNALGEKKFGF